MTRIEAGLVLINVEFSSSRFAFTDHDRVTPKELGFGWMLKGIDADDRPFIGRNAIRRELADKTSRWSSVGLFVDYADYNRVYNEAGLIPPKDETPLDYESMLYDDEGERVGYATSLMYSPMLQRHIAMARVRPDLAKAGSAGQPRAHDQPPVRDGRGSRDPTSFLQPSAEDGLTYAKHGQELRRDHRRRRAQRPRQRRLPGQGRPQGAHRRATGHRRRCRDHRGAATRLLVHVVLVRTEHPAARHRAGPRPRQARLHADPDAVVVRADGERRLPAARSGPRREHQGDHAALAARRRRDGPLRARRRAGLPGRQAAARQGAAEHLRQVAGGARRDGGVRPAPQRRGAEGHPRPGPDAHGQRGRLPRRLLRERHPQGLHRLLGDHRHQGRPDVAGLRSGAALPHARRARRALRSVVVPQGRQRRLHPGARPRGAVLRRRDHAQRAASTT